MWHNIDPKPLTLHQAEVFKEEPGAVQVDAVLSGTHDSTIGLAHCFIKVHQISCQPIKIQKGTFPYLAESCPGHNVILFFYYFFMGIGTDISYVSIIVC